MTTASTCVQCGCTDLRACAGGCAWLAVNHKDGTGVCSNCGPALTAWRAQQADAAAPGQRDLLDGVYSRELIQIGPLDV